MEVPPLHLEFLRNTELYFEYPGHLFVHAGLRPELTVKENLQAADEAVFLYYRGHITADVYAWEKRVVFGHTPMRSPLVTPFMIGIDTGCVYRRRDGMGRLTALCLPGEVFVMVDNCEPTAKMF